MQNKPTNKKKKKAFEANCGHLRLAELEREGKREFLSKGKLPSPLSLCFVRVPLYPWAELQRKDTFGIPGEAAEQSCVMLYGRAARSPPGDSRSLRLKSKGRIMS